MKSFCKTCLSIILISLLIVLISYLLFKIDNHSFFYSFKIIVILSLTFIFYLSVFIFFTYQWQLSIIITTIALVFTSLFFEFYLKNMTLAQNPYLNKAHKLALFKDPRSKFQVIQDFKSKGIQAVPSINNLKSIEYEIQQAKNGRTFYPLSGISNTFTVNCNESGFWSTYHSDKYGFNNPNIAYEDKSIDIVLIGDSFILGNCVKEGQDLASKLRNFKLNTLNFGYAGNGPLTELATIIEYGKKFKPSNVFWFFFRGDLEDLNKELYGKFLENYLINIDKKESIKDDKLFSQNLIFRQEEIDNYLNDFIAVEEEKFLNKNKEKFQYFELNNKIPKFDMSLILKDFKKLLSFKNNIIYNQDLKLIRIRELLGLIDLENKACLDFACIPGLNEQFSQIILYADKIVESWGGEFYFVYLPSWWEYSKYKKNYLDNKREVLDIVESNNIKILDFNAYLAKTNNPQEFFANKLPNHYNEKGYQLLSEQIYTEVFLKND